MVSTIARRLIGETEVNPPSSSIAGDWFSSLNDQVKDILLDGEVKHLEIEAVALLVPDDPNSEESTEHVATWEEAFQDGTNRVDGYWTTVSEPGQVTGYAIYARMKGGRVAEELAQHVSDHRTHDEAETAANGIAALLGVHVIDYSIAVGPVEENYGSAFIDRLVGKALKPYLYIKFLDGGQEELLIPLKWHKDVYTTGSSWHPGLVANPTKAQLAQIGGRIGRVDGGEYAMEVIHYHRYDGEDRSGTLHEDPEELQRTAEETPKMWFRPLKYEYRNEGEPPEELYM